MYFEKEISMIKELTMLKQQLNKTLKWNQARLSFLAGMLLALIKVKTVNLAKLASAFTSQAKANARYRRIQRFLRDYEIKEEEIAKIIMQMTEENEQKVLIIDKIEWKFGKRRINILILAVPYEGVAVPVFWKILDDESDSNTQISIALIEKFLSLFSTQGIAYITGNKEFIGKEWIGYLLEQKIDFCIRIKEDSSITRDGHLIAIATQIADKKDVYLKDCKIYGYNVNIAAQFLETESEYLLLIGNNLPEKLLEDYKNYLGIEGFFSYLERLGFDFEHTHLADLNKISKLVAILTIAFLFAVKTGQWRN